MYAEGEDNGLVQLLQSHTYVKLNPMKRGADHIPRFTRKRQTQYLPFDAITCNKVKSAIQKQE